MPEPYAKLPKHLHGKLSTSGRTRMIADGQLLAEPEPVDAPQPETQQAPGTRRAKRPRTHAQPRQARPAPAPIPASAPTPPRKAASARVETDARGLPVCCAEVRAVTMGTGRPRARCACGKNWWRRPGSDLWEKEPG